MERNIKYRFLNAFNSIKDLIKTGNNERQHVITELNNALKASFDKREITHYCSIQICDGDPKYKHELTQPGLKSGLRLIIVNDLPLSSADSHFYGNYFGKNIFQIRRLIRLGFDTLILSPKNKDIAGIKSKEYQIALKDFHDKTPI